MNSPEERASSASATPRGAGATYAGLPPGAVWRAAWFFGLWLVLAGADPADLPAAAMAVVAATWTSLHLLPPGGSRPSPLRHGPTRAALPVPVRCRRSGCRKARARSAAAAAPGLRDLSGSLSAWRRSQRVHHAHEPVARHGAGRRGRADSSCTTASTSTSRWCRNWPQRKRRCRGRFETDPKMTEFLTRCPWLHPGDAGAGAGPHPARSGETPTA